MGRVGPLYASRAAPPEAAASRGVPKPATPEKDIIREAEVLIAKGRKEIVLTGINTAL